jgi:hypothetical protein
MPLIAYQNIQVLNLTEPAFLRSFLHRKARALRHELCAFSFKVTPVCSPLFLPFPFAQPVGQLPIFLQPVASHLIPRKAQGGHVVR